MTAMTVGEMKQFLKQFSDITQIWVSVDEEGNNYHPLDMGYTPARVQLDQASDPAIILWPGWPATGEILMDENGEAIT